MNDAARVPARRLSPRGEDGFSFEFEGRTVPAWPGETVASALCAAGERWLRTAENGDPRGAVCGVGTCWECRCLIDGRANVRACVTEARPGMKVRRQGSNRA